MRSSIFLAIPCGEFYQQQARIIKGVCTCAGLDAIIVEHGLKTSDLWATITQSVEDADYFVADISSMRPNIMLELGYALREKPESRIGIFIAKSIRMPADLDGKKRIEYSSFSDFQRKLIGWLEEVVGIDPWYFAAIPQGSVDFREEFQDYDRFDRYWSLPPGCNGNLTAEGLRFSNADPLPILSKTLGLLTNFEFAFTARIEQAALGWVVKGTTSDTGFPEFCVMFNTDLKVITPHILDMKNLNPASLYHIFPSLPANIATTPQGWFSMTTRCQDDTVTVVNDGRILFSANFATDPTYSSLYGSKPKQGQVGFRCHRNEQAVVRKVEVREI